MMIMGFGNQKLWYNYLSIQHKNDKAQIILTLQDKENISHSYSLRDWKTRLESKKRLNENA